MFGPRIAAFLILALGTSGLVKGADAGSTLIPNQWSHQFHTARQLCQTGQFEQATQLYSSILEQLKLAGSSADLVARAYDELAVTLKVTGHFDEAEKNYLRALDVMERIDGHAGSRVGAILSDIGAFYVEAGQLTRGEHYLMDSRDVLKDANTAPYFSRAAIRQNLASLYYHQGQFAQAEAQFREALDILRHGPNAGRPQLAVVLGDLGQVMIAQDRAEQAGAYVKEAVSIFESLAGRFQSNYYAVLVIDANLQKALGDVSAASQTCDRALSLGDQVLGETNPRLIGALDLCSGVYKAQHRRKEAKQLASRSQALRTIAISRPGAADTVDVATLMKQNGH